MKKKIGILLINLLFISIIYGQNKTYVGDIKILTQGKVDAFLTQGIEILKGNLIINTENLNSLTGLSSLKKIEGDLTIKIKGEWFFTNGIENLTIITGSLNIYSDFQNFYDLPNLKFVGENLRVSQKYTANWGEKFRKLTEIGGSLSMDTTFDIPNLTILDGSLYVHSKFKNDRFSSLNKLQTIGGSFSISRFICTNYGLQNLEQIVGDFTINEYATINNKSFPKLSKVNGNFKIMGYLPNVNSDIFNNLSTIGGKFLVLSTKKFKKLSGFNNLKRIGNKLEISFNDDLEYVTGFNNLLSIKKSLYIQSNYNLIKIDGFNKLPQLNYTYIINNSSLKTFSGFSKLYKIKDLGFINHFELVNASFFDNIEIIENNLRVTQNGKYLDVIQFRKLTSVGGDVNILKSHSSDLSLLNSLHSINGSLKIANNKYLVNLDGLTNLRYSKDIEIYNNSELISYCGLKKLALNIVDKRVFNTPMSVEDIIDDFKCFK